MDRRIYHGNITPSDIARALQANFNRGHFHAQTVGNVEALAVQIATLRGSRSGGETAITVGVHAIEDGVMVELGEQSWLGVAASMGATAVSVLFRPMQILGRLDDIAQDIESIQLNDSIWRVIEQAVEAAGASHALSERLSRLTCEYCGTANPVGEGRCIACGAPLGEEQPGTCQECGYVVARGDQKCPNCGAILPH
jgi:double zinc ribbon protein